MPIPSVTLSSSMREDIIAMSHDSELRDYIKARIEEAFNEACAVLAMTPEVFSKGRFRSMTPSEAAGRIIAQHAAEVKAIIQLYSVTHY